jgi:GGDEF domain-containing protein
MACAAAPFATSTGYIAVTASFGVAVVESQSDSTAVASQVLLSSTDAALYRSKREGRNRVSLAERDAISSVE